MTVSQLEYAVRSLGGNIRDYINEYYDKRKMKAFRVMIRHLRNQKQRKPESWYGQSANFLYKKFIIFPM